MSESKYVKGGDLVKARGLRCVRIDNIFFNKKILATQKISKILRKF